MSINIYGLNDSWVALDAILEETGGEITPEAGELLETLISEAPDALERAGFYLKFLEAEVGVIDARRQALAANKAVKEAKAEKVRTLMADVLKRIGKPVKLPEFTLSTQTRTSYAFEVQPGVELFELPTQFWKQPDPVLVKSALNEAAKAGTLPDGVVCSESTNTSLMIRTPKAKAETETPAA